MQNEVNLKLNTHVKAKYAMIDFVLPFLLIFAHVLGRGAVFAQNRVWDELLVLRQVKKKHEKQS